MSGTAVKYDAETLQERILTFRDQKVILDADLALLYGVPTKALNQAVKRNITRFPADFIFQLGRDEAEEWRRLRSQSVTLNKRAPDMRSQIVTAADKRNTRFLPYAFTEHGAIMAATVLNSPQAVEMSVFVVRAFIKMREQLLATTTLAKRLAEVEKLLLTHDSALRDLYQRIRPLLLPPPEPERKAIGFGVKESPAKYRATRVKRGIHSSS